MKGNKGSFGERNMIFCFEKNWFSAGSIQWKKYGWERVPASDGSLGGRRCGCPTPTPHFALTLPLLPLMLGRNLILRGWKEVCCMLRTHFALIQMPAHHKTLFYPDSFTGDILGWHGMAKENYAKGKMWWGRMSDTWTLFYNMRIKVFWELFKVWFWNWHWQVPEESHCCVPRTNIRRYGYLRTACLTNWKVLLSPPLSPYFVCNYNTPWLYYEIIVFTQVHKTFIFPSIRFETT